MNHRYAKNLPIKSAHNIEPPKKCSSCRKSVEPPKNVAPAGSQQNLQKYVAPAGSQQNLQKNVAPAGNQQNLQKNAALAGSQQNLQKNVAPEGNQQPEKAPVGQLPRSVDVIYSLLSLYINCFIVLFSVGDAREGTSMTVTQICRYYLVCPKSVIFIY